jgi:hypothetical protein
LKIFAMQAGDSLAALVGDEDFEVDDLDVDGFGEDLAVLLLLSTHARG